MDRGVWWATVRGVAQSRTRHDRAPDTITSVSSYSKGRSLFPRIIHLARFSLLPEREAKM